MKYRKLTGIILKKQNYKEADQILTVFSRELGKVRVFGRGLRKPSSKLNYAVQDMAVVEMEIVQSKIPTLISAKAVCQFMSVREDLSKTASAFFVMELVLKTTADENPHPEVYDLLLQFFSYLNDNNDSDIAAYAFALKLMSCIGFSIERAERSFDIPEVYMSSLQEMRVKEFENLDSIDLPQGSGKIKKLVRDFIQYVLERNLKSEPFLISVK
jgi:recombinational DNA repair protein (RecF pathway)